MDNLKEKTAGGLLWGALNSGSMQILNALIGFVLARLLDPADYGIVGMLTIFIAIAGNLRDSGFGQLKADYGQRLQRRLLVQPAFQSGHLRPTLLLRAADCRLLPSARPRLTFARHLPEFCDFKFRTFA